MTIVYHLRVIDIYWIYAGTYNANNTRNFISLKLVFIISGIKWNNNKLNGRNRKKRCSEHMKFDKPVCNFGNVLFARSCNNIKIKTNVKYT